MNAWAWWVMMLVSAASTGIVVWIYERRVDRLREQLEAVRYERDNWRLEAMSAEARLRGVGGKGGSVPLIEVGRLPRERFE